MKVACVILHALYTAKPRSYIIYTQTLVEIEMQWNENNTRNDHLAISKSFKYYQVPKYKSFNLNLRINSESLSELNK